MARVIAIHGGAGVLDRSAMSPALCAQYHSALKAALAAGLAVLQDNDSALNAVIAAVKVLEDDPLFNAGRGSVYTSAGTLEMDASVMEGSSRLAGAVTGLWGPRHPIEAARAVMDGTRHVMLAGAGAASFCQTTGIEHCLPAWFETEQRQHQLTAALAKGTVGAVALDCNGHLAAATSTGGMTGKLPGRVGDSPLIGSGTWACDQTCAVSCTGQGESFIRIGAAQEVHLRMLWGGQSLAQACREVIGEELRAVGGEGGLVAVDAGGNVEMPYSTEGMYRGFANGREVVTAIFNDDLASV